MKNFLILVLALVVTAAAYLTRPDPEEFERYVRARHSAGGDRLVDGVEFKDFYLWTVVRKDGKTIYTGVFDHWVDNEQIKQALPS